MLNSRIIRYGKIFHWPRQIFKFALAKSYPVFIRLFKLPAVASVPETLEQLTDSQHSLVRFGDGEILYLIDRLSLPFQVYDKNLAQCFSRILSNNTDKLLVGLPTGYHSLDNLNRGGKIFWKSQIVWNYPRFRRFLNFSTTYANASVTRLYYGMIEKDYAKRNFQLWKQALSANSTLLIEGEKTRFGVGNDLLKNSGTVHRILGPKHHAFKLADEIIAYVKTLLKPDLILIALGPAAKYIAYHLHLSGYRVIDVGNLDIEYEWFLRGVKERVAIPGKYTSEAKGGREVADIDDPIYESQIIARFL